MNTNAEHGQDEIKQEEYMEKKEIRIVLLGKTGSGKSATGNYIMGQKYFESKVTGKSVTTACLQGISMHAERKLFIVDTPGLFHTYVSQEKLKEEIGECIIISTPGPHVFLLTVSIGNITEEEIQTFNHLFEMFGESVSNYAIVAFTRLDDVKRDNSTIEEFIESSETLKSIVRRCNYRYFAFDNTEFLKDGRKTALDELVKLIDKTVDANRGKHYSHKMYQEAKKQFQLKIQEAEDKKAAERQGLIEQTEYIYTKQINSANQKHKELTDEITVQAFTLKHIKSNVEKVFNEMRDVQTITTKRKSLEKDLHQATQSTAIQNNVYITQLEERTNYYNSLQKIKDALQREFHGSMTPIAKKIITSNL